MSARLDLRVSVPLHPFTLEAAFETESTNLGLFGESGAGKTTLLEAIAGLRRGVEGRIAFGGAAWLDSGNRVDLPPEARGVGYVPQESLLFPHWSVEGNVLAGSRRARRGERSRIDPSHVLDVLDLQPLRARPVTALSGGERQRVALARALCSGASLLLLDEPLASIDQALRGRILHYLLAVRDEFRIPTIYVSHDPTEIVVLCGEVVVLREGKVAARGRPGEVFTVGSARAGVEGGRYENVLEGTVAEVTEGRAAVTIAGGHRLILAAAAGAAPGAHVLVGVHAGELMIALADTPGISARNVIPGTIRSISGTDGDALVHVSIGEGALPIAVMVTSAARGSLGLREGLPVRLVAKAQACRLLAVR